MDYLKEIQAILPPSTFHFIINHHLPNLKIIILPCFNLSWKCSCLFQNVARLHREKSLADSTIAELQEKLQTFEVLHQWDDISTFFSMV